jgi:hypothetical protein
MVFGKTLVRSVSASESAIGKRRSTCIVLISSGLPLLAMPPGIHGIARTIQSF